MKYDVFISYSRKDYVDKAGNIIEGNIITQIKELLASNGYTYWFDETGIYSGDEFVGVITEAIQNSEIFLFVSSANSNNSDWTNHEIAVAKLLKKKTIPFKVDNAIYNTSILMYLAPLDFIDYPKNPAKAFDALIASLKNHYAKLDELQKRHEEEEKRKQKEQEEAEAKLKAEEAKNRRLAAIDNEIAALNNDIEKQTAAKLVLQSKIEQLKEKMSGYSSDVDSINEQIKSIYLTISNLEKEKGILLGEKLGTSSHTVSKNSSNVLGERNQNKYIGKNYTLTRCIEWLKNLEIRYYFTIMLLVVFGFLSVIFVLVFLFDNFQIEYISSAIMTGGVVLGVLQLFRKNKNGISILFFNGILGFFLGLFTIDCYRPVWIGIFGIYQFFVFIIYLIHNTDNISDLSFKNMKGIWIKKPILFFPSVTLLFLGLSYLIPLLYATSAGMKNYDIDECDDFLSYSIRGVLGDRWYTERVGDFYLNYYSKALLKRNPRKAYEMYLLAGLADDDSQIQICKQYFDIEEKGYHISPIYGRCGFNDETDDIVKIDINKYDGKGLNSNGTYEFKILGKHENDSLINILVDGASLVSKGNDTYSLYNMMDDSVRITYVYRGQVYAERVVPVKSKPILSGPKYYEMNEVISLHVEYPVKDYAWNIYCGDELFRSITINDNPQKE